MNKGKGFKLAKKIKPYAFVLPSLMALGIVALAAPYVTPSIDSPVLPDSVPAVYEEAPSTIPTAEDKKDDKENPEQVEKELDEDSTVSPDDITQTAAEQAPIPTYTGYVAPTVQPAQSTPPEQAVPLVPTTTEPTAEEPTKPEEPVEPVEPTEPEEPVKPVEPTEPEEPVKPVEPTEPEEPVKPVEPTESEEPVKPVEPTEPEGPINPDDDQPGDDQPGDDQPGDDQPGEDTEGGLNLGGFEWSPASFNRPEWWSYLSYYGRWNPWFWHLVNSNPFIKTYLTDWADGLDPEDPIWESIPEECFLWNHPLNPYGPEIEEPEIPEDPENPEEPDPENPGEPEPENPDNVVPEDSENQGGDDSENPGDTGNSQELPETGDGAMDDDGEGRDPDEGDHTTVMPKDPPVEK